MIDIGGKTFSSAADVRGHLYNLLNNAPVDEPLTGADGEIVHEVFLHHPEAKEKIGDQEIQYFKIGKHQQAGARAFCIVRSDDTEETFSIKKCISAWTRANTQETTSSKKQKPQQQVAKTLNLEQASYPEGLAGLVVRFQRVVELHAQLGLEIEQIQKLLAEESNR